MMYSSLFEELEDHLGCISDAARRAGLDAFFAGPARASVDWEIGPDRRTATQLFIHYLAADSTLWDEAYLEGLSPLLPCVLLGQLNPLLPWAYSKKPTHPLIVRRLQNLLCKVRFNPDAAEELILNDAKRRILIQTLTSSPLLSDEEKRLKGFCEKINAFQKAATPLLFFTLTHSMIGPNPVTIASVK